MASNIHSAGALTLSPRLAFLADWVPAGARLADVGTDHAYLPVWLDIHGRVQSAIAADLRPGPLERARETGRRYGAQHVDFRLCDGLSAISAEECDTIVIAGMGGENTAQILKHAPWTADGCHTLLLEPHSRAEVLRGFLAENGYAIRREALIWDRGFLYPVMEVTAGEMTLSPGQLYCGAKLLHDPLGDRYIIERIIQLQGVVVGKSRSASPEDRAHADYQRALITELLTMREEWRHANCKGN